MLYKLLQKQKELHRLHFGSPHASDAMISHFIIAPQKSVFIQPCRVPMTCCMDDMEELAGHDTSEEANELNDEIINL